MSPCEECADYLHCNGCPVPAARMSGGVGFFDDPAPPRRIWPRLLGAFFAWLFVCALILALGVYPYLPK